MKKLLKEVIVHWIMFLIHKRLLICLAYALKGGDVSCNMFLINLRPKTCLKKLLKGPHYALEFVLDHK